MASTIPFTLDVAAGPVAALCTPPAAPSSGTGVVLVPPFGWDEVCSYRDRRDLAATLAAAGHTVVRPDLPGTGDSAGGPATPGLVGAWQQAVVAAAAWLREAGGAARVAGVGIGSGGLLAAAAADGTFDELVLWGTPARGRRVVRELRALQNLEVHAEDARPDPVPEGALVAAGYLLGAETLRDLEALTAGAVPGLRRALLLGRGEAGPDAALVEALQAGGAAVDAEPGPGWTALQTDPDHPASDEGTFARIASWLAAGGEAAAPAAPPTLPAAAVRTLDAAAEEARHLDGGGFAVVARPVAGAARPGTVVFVGAGAVRHSGPNRMWVDAARRLAADGHVSARVDLPGVGEADGDDPVDYRGLYSRERRAHVGRVLSDLRALGLGGPFVVVGLCSGGYTGFHAVADEADVAGACLLNPNLIDDTVDPEEAIRGHDASGQVRTARSARSWRRLLRGEIPLRTVAGVLRVLLGRVLARLRPRGRSAAAHGVDAQWARIAAEGRHVRLVFASDEPLEREWAASGERARLAALPGVEIVDVPQAGHTFRPLWAQREALGAIEASVRTIVGPAP